MATIVGDENNNALIGTDLDDWLIGLGGADTLDGGLGADLMEGGTGDDTYVVDDLSDTVVENADEGIDTVLSAVTYTLGADLENLTLTGFDSISGIGNALANTITGNAGSNVLEGNAGVDTLFGAEDDDALFGGDDDDALSGDAGDDLMDGGAGTFDIAVFSGNRSDYVLSANLLGGVQVVDTRGIDSSAAGDRILDIEFLQFADGTVAFVSDALPTGAPTIGGALLREGEALTADIAAITDANGIPIGTIFSFAWQQSDDAGGTWNDIVGATGASFTPTQAQVQSLLRVRVQFVDDALYLETVFSDPTTPIGDLIVGDETDNVLLGTDFDDRLVGLGGADALDGGLGADELQGGAGDDIVNGGDGNDVLFYAVGDGADTVDGGLGDDVLHISGDSGTQTLGVLFDGSALTTVGGGAIGSIEIINLDLGDGADTLSYEGSTGVVVVNLAAGVTSGFDAIAGVESVVGGLDSDILVGSTGANVLSGGDGDDAIDGGAGDDTLVGGAGSDTLNGGAGVDTADYSGEIDDLFISIPGNMRRGSAVAAVEDILFGIENVTGGAGADAITGSGAANVLSGGFGGDTLLGAGGDDTLDGDDGDDALRGGVGADTLFGGAGNDTFTYIVGDGADGVDGGDDADSLNVIGTGGADMLDVVYDGAALTAFEGGTLANIEAVAAAMGGGVDTLSYAGSLAGVTVTLNTSAASGFASASSVENVIGGDGNDTLSGNAADNVLDGGVGDDTLSGGVGADTMTGGVGADSLRGGVGVDIIDAGGGDDTILYQYGEGLDTTIDGGADTDAFVITGNGANNTLNVFYDGSAMTSALAMTLTGIEVVSANLLGGTDTLSFTSTTAAISVDLAAGTATSFGSIAGIENLIGGRGNDTLTGNSLANNINGGSGGGVDILDGAGGNDTLNGGGGNDSLTGGAGDDAMTGGGNNDAFVFAAGFGADTITDFDANSTGGQDLLDISAFGITAADFASRVTVTDLGNDTLLVVDGTNSVTLLGVSGDGLNVITQADFILGGP